MRPDGEAIWTYSWQATGLARVTASSVLSDAERASEGESKGTAGPTSVLWGNALYTFSVVPTVCTMWVRPPTPGGRIEMHNAGRGPKFTACRRPVTLVYSEAFDSMQQARQREIQIKKWSHAKKEALLVGDLQRLHKLSRRRR